MRNLSKQLKDYDLSYVLKTAAPTPTDDGYPVPFLWMDTSANAAYLLTDNASGNATWVGLGTSSLIEWQDSVKDRYDPTSATPAGPSTGDRYISTATANDWTTNYIYEYDGVSWDETVPTEGFVCFVDDENALYIFDGSSWGLAGTFITHNNLAGRDTAAAHPATAVSLDTTNFDGILSTEDDTQEAIEALDSHKADHIAGGGDEIDGDTIQVTWTPTTYTADTSPSEVTNSGELTAHLKGVDTRFQKLSVETKTDDYNILTTDFGKSLRMNSAADKIFTLPSVGDPEDGALVEIVAIGAGKLTASAADSDKVGTSATAPGSVFTPISGENSLLVMEYVHAITTWGIRAGFGTWETT